MKIHFLSKQLICPSLRSFNSQASLDPSTHVLTKLATKNPSLHSCPNNTDFKPSNADYNSSSPIAQQIEAPP